MKRIKLHIDLSLPQCEWIHQLKYDTVNKGCDTAISLLYAHDTNMRLSSIKDTLIEMNKGRIVKTIFFSWFNFNIQDHYFDIVFGEFDNPKNSIIWNPNHIQFIQLPCNIAEVENKILKFIEND